MTERGFLRFQTKSVMVGHKARHVLIDRITLSASLLGGLYESHLAMSSFSPATVEKALEHVAALLTWDAETGNSATSRLAYGQPLTEAQIRNLKRWLEARGSEKQGRSSTAVAVGSEQEPANASTRQATVNATLRGISAFEDWCLRYALARHGFHSHLHDVREIQKEFWSDAQGHVPRMQYAEDFSDEEILEIEQYLRGLAFHRSKGGVKRKDFRTYVMWRMAIEYGLRVSEMLATRLQDLPSRTQNYLRIVRIEERSDPPDPRGKRSPRPKTLSRDLGTYFANSSFPDLFAKYVVDYRWTEAFDPKRSVMRRQSVRDHHYLFIADNGNPLARSTAEGAAAEIAKELGIDFHWHRARHSFFNRIYSAVDRMPNPSDRERGRQQLKYLGGWASDESLLIYTNTARRNAAREATFLLSQPNEKPVWKVLS